MRLDREFFTRKTLKVAKDLLGKFIVRKYKSKLLIGKIIETEAYIGPFDKASHAYSKREQPIKEKLKVIEQNWERIKDYIEDKELFIKRILYGTGKHLFARSSARSTRQSGLRLHFSSDIRPCLPNRQAQPTRVSLAETAGNLKETSNWKVTPRNLAEYLRGGHIYIYLVYGNYYQLNITTYQEGYPECVLIRSLEPILNLKNPKGPGKVCEELHLDSTFWGEDLTKSKRIWLEDEIKINGFVYKSSGFKIIKAKRIGIDYAEEYKEKLWRFYIKDNKWVSKK